MNLKNILPLKPLVNHFSKGEKNTLKNLREAWATKVLSKMSSKK